MRLSLLAAIGLILGALAWPVQAKSLATQPAVASKPAEKDGLSVTVILPKATFAADEPIRFALQYKNVSDKPMWLYDADWFWDWTIRFEDPKAGGPWRLRHQFEVKRRPGPAKELKPGQTLDVEVDPAATKLPFDFVWDGIQDREVPPIDHLRPGKYRLTVGITFRENTVSDEKLPYWKGTIVTDPVEVEIVSPPASAPARAPGGITDSVAGLSVDQLIEAAGKPEGADAVAAIIRLRDLREAKAVPVLEKVLARDLGTTRVFGFAAAQALFAIGTPEAADILKKHLASPQYDADMSIDYTFHWKMEPAMRDRFIEQYHLQSTSDEVKVQLLRAVGGFDLNQFTVRLFITNTTDRPLRILNPRVYLGKRLLLQDADGHFLPRIITVKYGLAPDPDPYPILAPKAVRSYDISCEIKAPAEGAAGLQINCRDMFHPAARGGKYKVHGLLCVARAYMKPDDKAEVWLGRAVSAPMEIDIQPPRR